VPVALKPGRDDPWTPYRIAQSLIAAGCPRSALSFYPTSHEGAHALLAAAGRSLLFGDASITKRYAGDPRVELHGPGYSKVLIGDDRIEGGAI
jgi:alpha-beta hydrolase superfamily lysophospholipase